MDPDIRRHGRRRHHRFRAEPIGDIVFVELPQVGRAISAGESFGSIESVKAVSELFAPMSGEVVAVNESLVTTPEAVNADPHGTWMIKLRLSNQSEAAALLEVGQYEGLLG
jgi:glycine cleavage system H protein